MQQFLWGWIKFCGAILSCTRDHFPRQSYNSNKPLIFGPPSVLPHLLEQVVSICLDILIETWNFQLIGLLPTISHLPFPPLLTGDCMLIPPIKGTYSNPWQGKEIVKWINKTLQGSALPVMSRLITRLTGVISPQLTIYFRPLIGAPFHSIYNDHRFAPTQTSQHPIIPTSTTLRRVTPLWWTPVWVILQSKASLDLLVRRLEKKTKMFRNGGEKWWWFDKSTNPYHICPHHYVDIHGLILNNDV